MDKWFHLTLHMSCCYLFILGLNLIHVNKRGPKSITFLMVNHAPNIVNVNRDVNPYHVKAQFIADKLVNTMAAEALAPCVFKSLTARVLSILGINALHFYEKQFELHVPFQCGGINKMQIYFYLTCLGLNKMDDILNATFSNAFYSMKTALFWFKYCCKYVPLGPIHNEPTLVMTWHW